MGELSRQRDARDLWISRSHLWAMAAGTLVLTATSFALGFTIGRDTAPAPMPTAAAAENDEQLVELLARVEASSRPHGGVEDLTFPDALAGQAPKVPDGLSSSQPVDGAVVVVDAAGQQPPQADAVPTAPITILVGNFDTEGQARTVRDLLRARGLAAWAGALRVDGKPVYRVGISGYANHDAAAEALAEIGPELEGVSPVPKVGPTMPSGAVLTAPSAPAEDSDSPTQSP